MKYIIVEDANVPGAETNIQSYHTVYSESMGTSTLIKDTVYAQICDDTIPADVKDISRDILHNHSELLN